MAAVVFTDPNIDISAEEKVRVSDAAFKSYYSFKNSMERKGKKYAAINFGSTYLFIFVFKKKLVLIQYAFVYDCLLIGAAKPLMITGLFPDGSISGLRKVSSGERYTKYLESVYPTNQNSTTVRSIQQRIAPEYKGIKTAVEICNVFNELPNNTSTKFKYLTCLSTTLAYADTTAFPYYSIFGALHKVVKSKITKAITTAVNLEDSFFNRILLERFLESLGDYRYIFQGINKGFYSDDTEAQNLNITLDYTTPYLDYNSDVYTTATKTEIIGRVYPVDTKALDVTAIDNPYILTITAGVKYNASYFFDVTDNVDKITVFDKTEAEISPENLRYLFDIHFPIDATELQTNLRNYISFYFEGVELQYRTEWDIYRRPYPYIVTVFDYALEKDIDGNDKVVNFDNEVSITITFLIVANQAYLADFNDPPASPITTQLLASGDGYDGYNQSQFSFYNISDKHTYYTQFSLADHDNFYIPNVANHPFKAAALPSPKQDTLPHVYNYYAVGSAPVGHLYRSGNITYYRTVHTKIHFNGYDTDVTHKSVWQIIATYSGVELTYYFNQYTGTSIGLPLPPVDKIITYGIGYSYFNEVVVHKNIGTYAAPYDSILNNVTSPDSIIEFYIIPIEELTDILSLIAYTENNLPIATLETGMQFEDPSQWFTNAGPSYNPSLSNDWTGFESYPLELLYYKCIHEDTHNLYGSYAFTNKIKWPVGVTSIIQEGFIGMQYPPVIQVMEEPLKYHTRNIYTDVEKYGVERFHRIYLVNLEFEKLGYCDIIWSGGLQMALHAFLQYQLDVTNIALDNKDPGETISAEDLATINLATNAYEAFQANYLSKILHNDFASYEFLYYLFAVDSVSYDSVFLNREYMYQQEVIMIVTTTEYAEATALA